MLALRNEVGEEYLDEFEYFVPVHDYCRVNFYLLCEISLQVDLPW